MEWPDPDEVIIGWVHSHPNIAGNTVPLNDTTCHAGETFIDQPSADDLNFSGNKYLNGHPGYILTKDRIVRFGTNLPSNLQPTSFPWSRDCD
jgi:hypothetical protein